MWTRETSYPRQGLLSLSFTWSSALITVKMLIVPPIHFHNTLRLNSIVNNFLLAMQSELFINAELAEPQFSNKKQTLTYNIIHVSKILGTSTVYLSAMANWCLEVVEPWCICYMYQFTVLSN